MEEDESASPKIGDGQAASKREKATGVDDLNLKKGEREKGLVPPERCLSEISRKTPPGQKGDGVVSLTSAKGTWIASRREGAKASFLLV